MICMFWFTQAVIIQQQSWQQERATCFVKRNLYKTQKHFSMSATFLNSLYFLCIKITSSLSLNRSQPPSESLEGCAAVHKEAVH